MNNFFSLIWKNKEYIAIAIIIFFIFRALKKGFNLISEGEKPSKSKKKVLAKKGGVGKILNKDLYREVAEKLRKIKGVKVEPTFYNAKEIAKNLSLYNNIFNLEKSKSFLKEITRAQSKAAISGVAHEYYMITKRDINDYIKKMDNESIDELIKYIDGLPIGVTYTE